MIKINAYFWLDGKRGNRDGIGEKREKGRDYMKSGEKWETGRRRGRDRNECSIIYVPTWSPCEYVSHIGNKKY